LYSELICLETSTSMLYLLHSSESFSSFLSEHLTTSLGARIETSGTSNIFSGLLIGPFEHSKSQDITDSLKPRACACQFFACISCHYFHLLYSGGLKSLWPMLMAIVVPRKRGHAKLIPSSVPMRFTLY
jgi:hypothetical protein